MIPDEERRLLAALDLLRASQERLAVISAASPHEKVVSTSAFDAWVAECGVGQQDLARFARLEEADELVWRAGWRVMAARIERDPNLMICRVLSVTQAENARQPKVDPVSGVAQRESLDLTLEAWFRHAKQAPFALVFVDVNALKSVNDDHGHLAGDACLRYVAAQLTQSVRDSDYVGRFGGDEFVVLLAGISTEQELRPLTDRLRAAVAGPITAEGQIPQAAASIGAALTSEGFPTARELLAAADRRMYAEKRTQPQDQLKKA